MFDEEPAAEEVEYSDDEEEALARRLIAQMLRAPPCRGADPWTPTTVASATGSPASLAANSALQTSVTPLAIQAGLGASRRCRRDATKLSL